MARGAPGSLWTSANTLFARRLTFGKSEGKAKEETPNEKRFYGYNLGFPKWICGWHEKKEAPCCGEPGNNLIKQWDGRQKTIGTPRHCKVDGGKPARHFGK